MFYKDLVAWVVIIASCSIKEHSDEAHREFRDWRFIQSREMFTETQLLDKIQSFGWERFVWSKDDSIYSLFNYYKNNIFTDNIEPLRQFLLRELQQPDVVDAVRRVDWVKWNTYNDKKGLGLGFCVKTQ